MKKGPTGPRSQFIWRALAQLPVATRRVMPNTKATRYMIDYLVETQGLSREQAYMLCSLAGDLKIAETVDVPHMLVTMHMPKSIFAGIRPKG